VQEDIRPWMDLGARQLGPVLSTASGQLEEALRGAG